MIELLKALYVLISAIPEVLAFLKELEKKNQERADDKNLKDDIKEIRNAIRTRDADAINRLFSGEEKAD